jgi:hypothetical protein
MECRVTNQFPIPSRKGVSRFSVLCGFVTMDLYWLYLTLVSHLINPVSIFIVDLHTGRHLTPGQIGNLTTTLDWSEVRLAVLLSLLVFGLATLVADAVSTTLAQPETPVAVVLATTEA